jgi:hypothetical protein
MRRLWRWLLWKFHPSALPPIDATVVCLPGIEKIGTESPIKASLGKPVSVGI